MMIKRLLALLFLTAATAQAQNVFDIEAGYRFLDLKGNSGMYRTQINEQEGLLIRSFSLSSTTPVSDRFRITASDFGTSPAGALRIEADRRGLYRFTLGYRAADQYSIFPNQHLYNRTRRTLDADLELFPDERFAPFVGYSFNRFAGPGETTYHVGQDEFLLRQKEKDVEQEIRAGVTFKLTHVYGSFTQGLRHSSESSQFSLVPGAGAGNGSDPILGQQISATTITRHDLTRVHTPFTNFYITGDVLKRLRLTGNYVRFAADSQGNENESVFGNFASFAISRFYTGSTESATSNAKNTTWRGGGHAEYEVAEGIDLIAGFQREHRELDGNALINTLYLQSITFGGVDQRDFQTVLNAKSSIDRDEDIVNAGIVGRTAGPFSFRAEVRQSKVDADVAPDLSEIVVPGSQGGSFERRVNTFDTNAQFSQSGFTLGAAFRSDHGNQPIFRTDFEDRDRYRLRAQWNAPKWVRLGAVAERTTMSNNADFHGHIAQYSGNIEYAPLELLSLRASASRFEADSSILFRHPETFAIDTSVNSENGNSREGGVTLNLKRLSLDAGLTSFHNAGTTPFKLTRYFTRAVIPIKGRYGIALEYNKDKYEEHSAYDFDATRYGIYLRIGQ
jgi:hypothetical protein